MVTLKEQVTAQQSQQETRSFNEDMEKFMDLVKFIAGTTLPIPDGMGRELYKWVKSQGLETQSFGKTSWIIEEGGSWMVSNEEVVYQSEDLSFMESDEPYQPTEDEMIIVRG